MTSATEQPNAPTGKELRIGISSCLLGESVRYDGGHKRDGFLTETLASFVSFVPVCPEVEVGMGIPREAIRLVAGPHGTRLVGAKSDTDHTRTMTRYAKARTRELARQDLSGYIFKKDSPSCGLFRVRLHDVSGAVSRRGRGLFAEVFAANNPFLPMEEEGRLRDPRLRENFFERVFAGRRLRGLFASRWGVGDLVRFHTAEKFLLMAHDERLYRGLGRLVAGAKSRPRKILAEEYASGFMTCLTRIATARKHANVLQHMAGHLKRSLDAESRAELSSVIGDLRRGLVPLIVPVTLIRHHVRLHGVDYLSGQSYLEPHPKELMLRNHV